ncbi:MAG: copper-binding protein [Caenispirillum sp.]|nr:copper-binding protein [Caenispirillum sp.]
MMKLATAISAATFFTLALPDVAVAQPSSAGTLDHSSMPGIKHQDATAVTGTGTINNIDLSGRKINLSHGTIEAIGWPAMTMDFAVAEGVDLAALEKGAAISFNLTRGSDGIYVVDSVRPQ